MPLHGEISLDARQAYSELRAFKKELQAITKDPLTVTMGVASKQFISQTKAALQEVSKQEIANAKIAESASREQLNAARAALAEEQKLTVARRQSANEAKQAAQQIGKAEMEAARVAEINSRTRLNDAKVALVEEQKLAIQRKQSAMEARDAAKTVAAEERRQIAQTKQASQTASKAERDARKEAADALRKQKEQGASLAREIDAGFRRNGTTINRFGDEVKTVTGHLRTMEAEMRKAKTARAELMDKLSTGSTYAGVAVLGAAGYSEKQFVEFDRSLRNVNSIAQLTEKQLQGLGDAVLKLADDPNIRKGPQDLSASLYTIYSSGKAGADALNILKDAALGASAGVTTTDTSAKVLLATLNSGIGGVNSSREAMNVLFKIVDRGVISFEQLAGTIGEVLPTAQAAGIPLQELGAAVAVMTKNGESAGTATNDLLNLITKLIRPPKEAKGAFDALGISYGVSALHAKGLGGVLAEIQTKTHGNKDALAKLLPDMQAYRGALILLKNHGNDYRTELEFMNKAQEGNGALMKAAQKQNQGAAYEYDKLMQQLQILAIVAGKSLYPALRSVVAEVRDGLKWFNSLDDSTKNLIIRGGLYAGVLLLVFGRIKDVITVVNLVKVAHNTAAVAAAAQGDAEAAAAAKSSLAWLKTLGVIGLVAAAGFAVYKSATEWTPDAKHLSDAELIKKYGPQGQFEVEGAQVWGGANRNENAGTALGILGGPAYGLAPFVGRALDNRRNNQSNTRDRKGYDAYVLSEQNQMHVPRSFEAWRAGVLPNGQYPSSGDVAPVDPAKKFADELTKQQQAAQKIIDDAIKRLNTTTEDGPDPLAGYGHKKTAAEKAAEKAERERQAQLRKDAAAALTLEKRQLDDVAKAQDMLATATEQSARRQIEAIKGVSDALSSGMKQMQDDLKGAGVKGNLLGGQFQAFLDFLNLKGDAHGIAAHYNDVAQGARDAANAARSRKDRLQGGDGIIPGYNDGAAPRRPGGSGPLAPAIPVPGGKGPKGANPLADLLGEFGSPLMRNLPKGWGPELSAGDGNAARMWMQGLLEGPQARALLDKTTTAINKPGFLEDLAKRLNTDIIDYQGDKPDDRAAALLRQVANVWDVMRNRAEDFAKAFTDATDAAKEWKKNNGLGDFGKAWQAFAASGGNFLTPGLSWDENVSPNGLSEYDPGAVARAARDNAFQSAGEGTMNLPLGYNMDDVRGWLKQGGADAQGDAMVNADEGMADTWNAYLRNQDEAIDKQNELLNPYKEQLKELRAALAYDKERLSLGHDLSESEKLQLQWKLSGKAFTAEELALQKDTLGVMQDMEIVAKRTAAADAERQRSREAQELRLTPEGVEKFRRWNDLKAANPDTSESVLLDQFKGDQKLIKMNQSKEALIDGLYGVAQAVGQVDQSFGGMVDNVIGGLKRMAQEAITNYLFKQLLGLAGLNDFTPQGNPKFTPANVPGGVPNPFDKGLRATLHHDSNAVMMHALRTSGATGGNRSVTVNIHNPVVDSTGRVQEIRNQVSQALGEQMGGGEALSGGRVSRFERRVNLKREVGIYD